MNIALHAAANRQFSHAQLSSPPLTMVESAEYILSQACLTPGMLGSQKEEEAKKKADEEARKKADEEAKKKADEDAKKKADEDAKKKADEEAKKKADEEAKKKAADAKAASSAKTDTTSDRDQVRRFCPL